MKDCNHNRIHEIEDSLYKNQDDRIYEIWDKIDERKMLRKKALKKKPTTNTKMKVNQNNLVVMKKNLIVARTNQARKMKKNKKGYYVNCLLYHKLTACCSTGNIIFKTVRIFK